MNKYGYCKSDKAFKGWISSALRRVWSNHPAKIELLNFGRMAFKSPKSNRRIYHNKCMHCDNWFPLKDLEINHIKTVGGFDLAHIGEVANNLLNVSVKDLERLCKSCHSVVTYSERSGLSIEDAKLEKKVIAFMNNNNAAEQKRKLLKVGVEPAKTIALRRDQVREIYMRKRK